MIDQPNENNPTSQDARLTSEIPTVDTDPTPVSNTVAGRTNRTGETSNTGITANALANNASIANNPAPDDDIASNNYNPSSIDKKASEIIGLPVITLNRGVKAFDVEDLILDPSRPQVLALLVQEKSLFQSALVIPFGYISAIGRDAVIIPDGKAIVALDRLKDRALQKLNDSQIITGLRVLTDDGRKLGLIEDMLIDGKTGEIKGYYMSLGRIFNVTQGSRFIPASKVISVGQRVLYISPQTADELEAQSGGIAGALDQTGDKLRTAGAKANSNLETWGEKVRQGGEKLNQQLGLYGDQARAQLPQRAGSIAVGKPSTRKVTAEDGTVIVNEGDVITEDNVDAARDAGRLPQLMLAAGVGAAAPHMENLGKEAGESWQQMREEAKTLWNQLTGNYNKSIDSADEKVVDRRIKNALGRPVDRVILDNDDNIILNTGDIITNRAVQAARDAGVLDILVNSVYIERPKLDFADLKAPRSGNASLENLVGGRSSRQIGSAPTETETLGTTVSGPESSL